MNIAHGKQNSETRVPSRVSPWWDAPPKPREVSEDCKAPEATTLVADAPLDVEHWQTIHHAEAGRVVTFDPQYHDGSLIWPD